MWGSSLPGDVLPPAALSLPVQIIWFRRNCVSVPVSERPQATVSVSFVLAERRAFGWRCDAAAGSEAELADEEEARGG